MESVEAQIQHRHLQRKLCHRCREVVRGNPRRLCDDRHVVTRRDYASEYPDLVRNAGHAARGLDRFARPGCDTVCPATLDPMLEEAAAKSEPIGQYVHQTLSHRDHKQPSRCPKYVDLDRAIDAVGHLLRYLVLLLRGAAMVDVTPVPQLDWGWVFRQPWLPPRSSHTQRRAE